ncbi:MAG: FAD-binding oxidoreductase, partial [Chloroflexi bacterium]|nr:FAD-binding oxidoreductase [Chloroflexota bacterium]
DRIVDYRPSDLVVVVEAGITVRRLQEELGKNGQRLAFDPPFPHTTTIGGALASNAVGPLRNSYGGVRDLVIGMSVVQADGTVTKSGGGVVKNVTGYDMARLHIGAFGTLGAIATVAFKIGPVPLARRTVAAWFDSVESAAGAGMRIINGAFMPEAITIIAGWRAASHASLLATQISGQLGDASTDTDGCAVLLLVGLASGPATVERQVNDTTSTLGGAMADGYAVLDDEAQAAAWTLATEPVPSPMLTVRSTLKPSSAFDLVNMLLDMAGPHEIHIVGHVGFGTVEAHWLTDAGPARGLISSARKATEELGGVLTIERCPTEQKADLDVFGEIGAPLDVMRRMKQQFDPDGNLSPGRFAGRI